MTNNPPPGDESIDDMAAEWLAWRDTGLSAQQAAEFARWRALDPRHDDAIRRIEAAQTLLARLPETPGAAAMYVEIDTLLAAHRQRTWRKYCVHATIGLAAAAAVALAIWLPLRTAAALVYATTADVRKSFDLPDGSTLALSGNSEVRVDFQPHERRLDLASGEAHFAVAKDRARPFVVSVGTVTVKAIGTAFTVRRQDAAVEVIVTEGKVVVTRTDGGDGAASSPAPLEPFNLAAGESARIPTDLALVADVVRPHAETLDAGAPGDTPQLVFANTPLAEAVERFNRHNQVQMEIGDPELRAKTLGGSFNANNAEAFIKLLIASGEISVERVSESRVVLLPARGSVP